MGSDVSLLLDLQEKLADRLSQSLGLRAAEACSLKKSILHVEVVARQQMRCLTVPAQKPGLPLYTGICILEDLK